MTRVSAAMLPSPRERKPMRPMRRKDKNGKDRWVARVWDKGKPGFRSLGTFDRKGDAQDVINEFYSRAQPRRRETCDSFAKRWADDYPRPKDSTNAYNRERVRKFGKDFHGIALADVDRPSARAWALENRQHVQAVRAMFSDALDDELVVRNPFSNLRLPQSRGRRDITALTEQQVQELADLALRVCSPEAAEMIRATILFSAYTGVRQGEMFALRWTDLGAETVTVARSLSKVGGFTSPKNGRERTVVLLPQAREALDRMPRRVDQKYVFVSPRDGNHLTATSHLYHWNKVRAASPWPRLNWHELRHAAATMMLERGLSPSACAMQLGHSDGGILVQRLYGHPDQERLRREVRQAFAANVVDLRDAKAS